MMSVEEFVSIFVQAENHPLKKSFRSFRATKFVEHSRIL